MFDFLVEKAHMSYVQLPGVHGKVSSRRWVVSMSCKGKLWVLCCCCHISYLFGLLFPYIANEILERMSLQPDLFSFLVGYF